MKVNLLTQGGWKTSQLSARKNWLDESEQQFYAVTEEYEDVDPQHLMETIDEEIADIEEKVAAYRKQLEEEAINELTKFFKARQRASNKAAYHKEVSKAETRDGYHASLEGSAGGDDMQKANKLAKKHSKIAWNNRSVKAVAKRGANLLGK